jgi:hypothetical protein
MVKTLVVRYTNNPRGANRSGAIGSDNRASLVRRGFKIRMTACGLGSETNKMIAIAL